MNIERFIAGRIIRGTPAEKQLSRPITRIAVLGIALGMTVMILAVAIVSGFQREIRNKIIGFGSHVTITNYDSNESDEPLPIQSDQPFLNELRSDPDVEHVQEFATKNGIIKTRTDNEGVVLKGVGKDFDPSFIDAHLLEGRNISVQDSGLSRDIIISSTVAARLGLKLEDKMVIHFLTRRNDSISTQYEQRAKVFYVRGIYETGYEDIDNYLVLVDIRQIRSLNYWGPDQTGGFEVKLRNFSKLDEAGERINIMVGQWLRAQTVKEKNPNVFSWLELSDLNATIVIVLMLLVAGINMISALLILILERTNMIGILKALGFPNWSIQKVFLYNAAWLIGRGLLFGNLAGAGLALFQKYTGTFKLDQATYYVSVIPIHLRMSDLLLLNAGTLVSCLLMLLLPSFIVSKISPVRAIRFS